MSYQHNTVNYSAILCVIVRISITLLVCFWWASSMNFFIWFNPQEELLLLQKKKLRFRNLAKPTSWQMVEMKSNAGLMTPESSLRCPFCFSSCPYQWEFTLLSAGSLTPKGEWSVVSALVLFSERALEVLVAFVQVLFLVGEWFRINLSLSGRRD